MSVQIVRERERPFNRQSSSVESITNAVRAVICGTMRYLKGSSVAITILHASRSQQCRSALTQQETQAREGSCSSASTVPELRSRCGRVSTLERESQLVSHITGMVQRLFGFTTKVIWNEACESCKANGHCLSLEGNSETPGGNDFAAV